MSIGWSNHVSYIDILYHIPISAVEYAYTFCIDTIINNVAMIRLSSQIITKYIIDIVYSSYPPSWIMNRNQNKWSKLYLWGKNSKDCRLSMPIEQVDIKKLETVVLGKNLDSIA